MAKQLSEKDLMELRSRGLLRANETAFKDGAVIVAEDVVSKVRRILNVAGLMLEANKQLLTD